MSINLGTLQNKLEDAATVLRRCETSFATAKRNRDNARARYNALQREIAEAFDAVKEGTAVP